MLDKNYNYNSEHTNVIESILNSLGKYNNLTDYKIYYKPIMGHNSTDLILMKKNIGVVIIGIVYDILEDIYENKSEWSSKFNNLPKISPVDKITRYKDSLFDLHINNLNITSYNSYDNLYRQHILTYVYFPNISATKLNEELDKRDKKIQNEKKILLKKNKKKIISGKEFDNKFNQCQTKLNKIFKKQKMYIAKGRINSLKFPKYSELFNESIYNEFESYFNPKYHLKQDGIYIDFSQKQERLSMSKPEYKKIKGVAGSGKTLILAKRAINAYNRHKSNVLILTYNITLRKYIENSLKNIPEDFDLEKFEILNYHQFINNALDNTNFDRKKELSDYFNDKKGTKKNISDDFERLFYSNEDLFKNLNEYNELKKYKSIFIDEIQDYRKEWIKIVKSYFLEKGGEFVVFGDEKQNIYKRELNKENSIELGVYGLGKWEKLTKGYRYQSANKINNLLEKFQRTFLIKYELDEFKKIIQQGTIEEYMDEYMFNYSFYNKEEGNFSIKILNKIFEMQDTYQISNQDLTILSSNADLLRKINDEMNKIFKITTDSTFATLEEINNLEKKIKDRKINNYMSNSSYLKLNIDIEIQKELNKEKDDMENKRKYHFDYQSKNIKLSTIHSFKGLESPTVVIILTEKDDMKDELVYTAISRAKSNVLIFMEEECKYSNFFKKELSFC